LVNNVKSQKEKRLERKERENSALTLRNKNKS